MNEQQYLLLKLMEECAEVSQQASKQIQFGRTEVQKNQDLTNGERLKNELLDLVVIASLLQEKLEIPKWTTPEFQKARADKKIKMQKYLDLSSALKQLPKITLS